MAASALTAVSPALFAVLPSIAGDWHDDVPQDPTYPFGLYEVKERNDGGLGARRGPHELEIRTRIFSLYGGLVEAQIANAAVVEALEDTRLDLSPTHRAAGGIFYDDTVPLPNQQINGVKVHELVSNFRLSAEVAS